MTDRPSSRTRRDEPLMREVRSRLAQERDVPARLRRLERMEQTARLWVNGREVGDDARFGYLAEGYD